MRTIIALLMLVGLTSCVAKSDAPVREETGTTVYRSKSGSSLKALEFTYKGHSYIWFHRDGGWDGANGMVHNPDCPCHNKAN